MVSHRPAWGLVRVVTAVAATECAVSVAFVLLSHSVVAGWAAPLLNPPHTRFLPTVHAVLSAVALTVGLAPAIWAGIWLRWRLKEAELRRPTL